MLRKSLQKNNDVYYTVFLRCSILYFALYDVVLLLYYVFVCDVASVTV